jgi:hypothetical protein
MKPTVFFLAAVLFSVVAGPAAGQQPRRELLKHYRGKEALPDPLFAAYKRLIRALERGDQAEIDKHCLPHAVSYTSTPRPTKTREYGTDVNLPFLKQGFDKYVRALRKDSPDTYLIRTGSTYMYFVKASRIGWKLYRYGDKPIE